MSDKQKVLVFIAANSAMQERLSTDRLVKEIADRGWVVSTAVADPPYDAIDALLECCRKQRPDGVVVAGPTSLLERLPSLVDVEGRASLRPVPVNLVERCAFLYADSAEALASAVRQIEVAAARSVSRQPIELEERAQQRVVLVVGTGASGARVANHLLSYDLQVIAVASDAEPRTPIPEKVELIKSGRLQALSGFPGDFQAVIAQPNGTLIRRVGALVIAPEANRGRPPLPDAVLSDERVVRISKLAEGVEGADFGGIRTLAFLLDLRGPESRAVAAEVRRLALEAVDQGITVTVFYRHVAVHGRTGQLEYDKLRKSGVRMIRYDRAPVVEQQIRGLHIVGYDMILGEAEVEVTVDRLIVTDPIIPAPISGELAHLLNQPVDREGFLQPANVRHLPVGSPRKGVYFAGSGHQDLSENEARREAIAVAGQVAALLSGSTMLAPKALVLHDRESCAMCLTCLRSCYHGAISLSDDGGTVRFEPAACWECGICASVCPQKAITRLFSPEAELRAAVEAAGKPIKGESPVIAFLCQNSPVLALERAGRLGLQLPRQVVIIEVPCAGYISQSEVLAALNAGADRVVVAACHEDNCRSLHGSTSARDRSGQVMSDLKGIGLSYERVVFAGVAANEPYRLIDIISGVAAASNGKQEVANA
jgi:coenzyme F420-reducing hydrogenase delta subunit/ferredoxin